MDLNDLNLRLSDDADLLNARHEAQLDEPVEIVGTLPDIRDTEPLVIERCNVELCSGGCIGLPLHHWALVTPGHFMFTTIATVYLLVGGVHSNWCTPSCNYPVGAKNLIRDVELRLSPD